MDDEEPEIISISKSTSTQTENTIEQDDNRSFDRTLLTVYTSLYLILVSIASRLNMPVPIIPDLSTWLQERHLISNPIPSTSLPRMPTAEPPDPSYLNSISPVSLSSSPPPIPPLASSISVTLKTPLVKKPISTSVSKSSAQDLPLTEDMISDIIESNPKVVTERIEVFKLPVIPRLTSTIERESKATHQDHSSKSPVVKKKISTTSNDSRSRPTVRKVDSSMKSNPTKGSTTEGKRSFSRLDRDGSNEPKSTKKVKNTSKIARLEKLLNRILAEQDSMDSEEE